MLSSIPTRFDGAWIGFSVNPRHSFSWGGSSEGGAAMASTPEPQRCPEAIETNQFKAIADVAFGCLGRRSASYTRAGDLE